MTNIEKWLDSKNCIHDEWLDGVDVWFYDSTNIFVSVDKKNREFDVVVEPLYFWNGHSYELMHPEIMDMARVLKEELLSIKDPWEEAE